MNYGLLAANFAESLKEERERRGLNIRQVADALGVREETIRRYEQHKRIPSLEKVGEICDLFGKTIDEFLGTEPRNKTKKVIQKDWFSGRYNARCPKCREMVYKTSDPNTTNRFCHRCGQALRWD